LFTNEVAKASPTPKEVFSFIVVRLARANSDTKSKNLYWYHRERSFGRSFLRDDNSKEPFRMIPLGAIPIGQRQSKPALFIDLDPSPLASTSENEKPGLKARYI
jgi:hypothetical protein